MVSDFLMILFVLFVCSFAFCLGLMLEMTILSRKMDIRIQDGYSHLELS